MPKRTDRKKPFRLSYRNRSLSFTPFGTRFVVVCVLVGIAAINTGSNLLYLCTAMMLSMMLVSGILSEQALKGLRAVRRTPGEIYAGEPFTVRYEVSNTKKRIPSFALSVAGYSDAGEQAAAFLLRLPPGGAKGAAASERIPRRGEWETDGFELSTRFPFGLFRKSLRLARRETMLVYPPVRKLPSGLPRSLTRGYGETPTGRPGRGDELRSLRDHQSYDDARLIHWKGSARLGRLLVKELEAEQKRTVTVILDDCGQASPDERYAALFEDAVALAAAAVRELLIGSDLPVAFISRGFSAPAGGGRAHYLAVMDGLAMLAPAVPDAAGFRNTDDPVMRAVADGPCVMVFPKGGTPWRRFSAGAVLVLEARP